MYSIRLVGARFLRPNVVQIRYLSLPAHTKITLPALSPTMIEGGLAKWKKKEGEVIKPGEVLCEIETDKATVDFEFQEDGTLAKQLVTEGSTGLKVGCVIAIMVDDASQVQAFANSKFADFNAAAVEPAATKPQVVSMGVENLKPSAASSQQQGGKKESPASSKQQQPQQPHQQQPTSDGARTERVVASPLARRLAREMNKNLQTIKGTGPNGRILAADVKEATEQAAGGAAGDSSWVLNKLMTPHYYLNVDVDFTEVLAACEYLNKSRGGKDAVNGKALITANDFIIRAAGLCMKRVPEANAAWGDAGSFRMYDYCDVNLSVTSPENGQVKNAILKNVHSIGLDEISTKSKDITERASKGQDVDETPGTFSMINVGEFGVRSIVPIIRPGQTTALGVGALRKTLVINEASPTSAKVATIGTVTLSCDHRVVDGAIGAEWLQNFKSLLEKPMSMLL